MLTQDFEFAAWEYAGKGFVAITLHQGADIHGGYTWPAVFESPDSWALCLYQDASFSCDSCGEYWYTDDGGYHFYSDSRETRRIRKSGL